MAHGQPVELSRALVVPYLILRQVVNKFGKLFAATVVVAVGYCLASLFGPPHAPRNSAQPRWIAAGFRSSDGGRKAGSQGGAVGWGHVRLTPDPSAIRDPINVGSPDISTNDVPHAGKRVASNQHVPLWLSAPPAERSDPNFPAEQSAHVATLQKDWDSNAAWRGFQAPQPDPNEHRPVATNRVERSEIGPESASDVGTDSPPIASSKSPSPIPGESTTERTAQAATQNVPAVFIEPDRPTDPPPESWAADEQTERTHIVVDGDSLPKLAERYLDDRRRAWEIFAINRDVLSNPQLLPIGVVLKLPKKPRDRAPIESAEIPAFWASSDTASKDGLVPVYPTVGPNGGQPKARLMYPEAAPTGHNRYTGID